MIFATSPQKTIFSLPWILFLTLLLAMPTLAIQEKDESAIQPLKNVIDKSYIELDDKFNYFPEQTTIDLTLRDTDVASILRILAKEGNMNIVIDPSVKGVITAELKNISINEAMQVILTSEELEARVSNDTIFIASRPVMAKKGLNRNYIKTFNLNNSDPVYVAGILKASIFNKGYKVDESAVSLQNKSPEDNQNGTSSGQSNLISGKTIKGDIKTLVPGENFGNASRLASEINIQHYNTKTGEIDIDNNDGGAIVIPDTRTNSILVAGLEKDILLAEEAIKHLDKPLKQVSIEVSLIEIKKDDSKDLGMSTSMHGGKTSGGFNALEGEFAGQNFSSLANQTGLTLNTINSLSDEIAVRLNALIVNEEAKLLANPKIIALDGSESLIKITDQVVSKVQTTITDTAVTYNADLSDVGIVLNILPKVRKDGYVTMRIRPSITNALPEVLIGEFQNGGAAIKVTPVSTREVIIQDVRVKSGETLAIAGLTKEHDVKKDGKVPVLGSIPVLGKLFSNTEFNQEKNELIIMITPVIIDDIAQQSL